MSQLPKNIDYPLSWQDVSQGPYFKRIINSAIEPWLEVMFGSRMLKLGHLSIDMDTHHCGINYQINMASTPGEIDLQADYERLPFRNDSIDACMLIHLLPYAKNPHQILREADRVLTEDGWIIMSSYNLFSLKGMGKACACFKHQPYYSGCVFSKFRLYDWFTLLNYEVMDFKQIAVLPWNSRYNKSLNRYFSSFGCINLILAKKKTVPLIFNPLRNRHFKLDFGRKVVGVTKTKAQDS